MYITLWEFVLVLVLIILAVLIILLIPTVLEFRRTLSKASEMITALNRDLPEIMENVADISDHVSRASKKINNTVADFVDLEEKITREIKEPALEAAATLAGILNGFQTFASFFIRRKRKK